METQSSTISVTLLGTGTCAPSLRRASCSFLAEIEREKLLFDIGPGVMRRLLEAGESIFDITHIFLSHFHPDHTGELVPFLFSNKYSGESVREKPLTLVGGKGLNKFFADLLRVYGSWIVLSEGMMNIHEMDNIEEDFADFGSFTIKTAPVEHNPESIAYRINTRNSASLVYSGDTQMSENLVELAREADLLICESAFPDEMRSMKHLTPSLAGEMATRADVKKLILTHFYPECDRADIAGECRKTYNGPLILGEDLLRLTI